VTTNVAAKPVTFLHGANHGCTMVSHMCSCETQIKAVLWSLTCAAENSLSVSRK